MYSSAQEEGRTDASRDKRKRRRRKKDADSDCERLEEEEEARGGEGSVVYNWRNSAMMASSPVFINATIFEMMMSCILLFSSTAVAVLPSRPRPRLPFVFGAPISHLFLRLQRPPPFFLLFLLPFICTKRCGGTREKEHKRRRRRRRRTLQHSSSSSLACVCVYSAHQGIVI